MAARIGGAPSVMRKCCLTICGGIPEMPFFVTQGSCTRQIEKSLDWDSLARLAEAILECCKFICRIWVGFTLGGVFLIGCEGVGGRRTNLYRSKCGGTDRV